MQVSTNGQISVHIRETNFVPRNFPTDKIIIAPFWADVDTRGGGGEIEYGVTRDATQLEKAQEQAAAAFPEVSFIPLYLVIATWDSVGYYNRFNRSIPNNLSLVRKRSVFIGGRAGARGGKRGGGGGIGRDLGMG